MSNARRKNTRATAEVFAALGDPTRLALLAKLSSGQHRSIADLTAGTKVTRQAVTKHLHILQRARVVHASRSGRESRFSLDPQPLMDLQQYLQHVSAHWDSALARLKAFAETEE